MTPKEIIIDGLAYDLVPKINFCENVRFPAAKPKQKDWEIVAYRFDPLLPDSIIVDCDSKHWTEAQENDNGWYSIWAVRRLSDNEVFAAGQKVFNREGEGVNWSERQSTIMGFSLMDYGCGMVVKLYSDGETSPNGDFVRELCDIKAAPARTPLFTTHDGKPIYEGDWYWCVWPSVGFVSICVQTIPHRWWEQLDTLTFSTEAAAEQWIADNKPMYSLNDIRETLEIEIPKWGGNKGIIDRLKSKK